MRYRHRYRYRRHRSVGSRILTAVSVVLPAAFIAALISGLGIGQGKRIAIVIAATATSNEPAPALSSKAWRVLRFAGSGNSMATAYVVDPNTGQARALQLTPRRANGQIEHGSRRGPMLAANIRAIQRVLATEAGREPFDLLKVLAAATRIVSPPATIIAVTSGLSSAGGFDLRRVGWRANPAVIAARLKRRRLLPDLRGFRVIFSGLGVAVGGPQPALSLAQLDKLASYWLAICTAARATSCKVDEMTRPDLPPRSTRHVPVVPVGQVTSVRGPGGTQVLHVPYSLLFSFNSATLISGANSTLRPIATQAVRGHLQVSITGHASPDGGTAAYNEALSSRRAFAVFRRLLTLGLPRRQVMRVRGVGFAGHTRNDCLVKGRLDEAKCARLRDVVVVLTPARRSNQAAQPRGDS